MTIKFVNDSDYYGGSYSSITQLIVINLDLGLFQGIITLVHEIIHWIIDICRLPLRLHHSLDYWLDISHAIIFAVDKRHALDYYKDQYGYGGGIMGMLRQMQSKGLFETTEAPPLTEEVFHDWLKNLFKEV